VLRFAVALLPVLLFLGLLMLIDSFKLVRPRAVLQSILAGGLAALVAGELNGALLDALPLSTSAYARYVAPPLEELLKATWLLALLRQERLGFLVDAAIHGFAVGAGFALVENVGYLNDLPGSGLSLWLARGLGTALLHGAATALFAMIAKDFAERRPGPFAWLPGLAAAAALHSLYNHFALPPLLAALLLLATLPIVLIVVFEHSDRATRSWLGAELESDMELLDLIRSGRVSGTRMGAYLESLKARFPALVVADMLCLLQIRAELSLGAKGLLIAREAGLELPVGDDVRASLRELRYLERSVGATGLLAMKPIQRNSSRALWQIYVLGESAASRGLG
jgi:protease PrsW